MTKINISNDKNTVIKFKKQIWLKFIFSCFSFRISLHLAYLNHNYISQYPRYLKSQGKEQSINYYLIIFVSNVINILLDFSLLVLFSDEYLIILNFFPNISILVVSYIFLRTKVHTFI